MIRSAIPDETDALVAIGVATGLFSSTEADQLLRETLTSIHSRRLGSDHSAYVWVEDGRPLGWTYFAPHALADGVWDVWWIGVDPVAQGRGVGAALLAWVETRARAAGARVLLIETSGRPKLHRTHTFYQRRGYAMAGRIPDFYGDGDDKIIFCKAVR